MSEEKTTTDNLNDMIDDAKEKASEFAEEAKEVIKDGKNVAIISHLAIIGWIAALMMNDKKKTELGTFYIKQMLGLLILILVCWLIPLINMILIGVVVLLWLMSLIGALSGKQKLVPFLGQYFQDWFKGI